MMNEYDHYEEDAEPQDAFAVTWSVISEAMEMRNRIEARFTKQCNAIKAGKLTVTKEWMETEMDAWDDGEMPKASAHHKKKGAVGMASTASFKKRLRNHHMHAAEEELEPPPVHSHRRKKDRILPPIEGTAVDGQGATIFADYIGLTTSDFQSPTQRAAAEKERQAEELRKKLEEAEIAASKQAYNMRVHLTRAVEGPCYGRQNLPRRLQLLRDDPALFVELNNAVSAYHHQTKMVRKLRNFEGRDPMKENKNLTAHLIKLESKTQKAKWKKRLTHEEEVRMRHKRITKRLFLEKFMIAERTQQQQQRAEMTSTGSGLTVPPEVLKAQGIANWIVIVMASHWFRTVADITIERKKEAKAKREKAAAAMAKK
jgi:hypothetical protein